MMNGNNPRVELLIFRLDGKIFGLPASDVQELTRAVAQTPMDGGATLYEGIIDLRGSLVPVVDLRRCLGLNPSDVRPSDHMIILRPGGRRLAIRVDDALELTSLALADDSHASEFGGSNCGVEGMVIHAAHGIIPVLSLPSMLRRGNGETSGSGARFEGQTR